MSFTKGLRLFEVQSQNCVTSAPTLTSSTELNTEEECSRFQYQFYQAVRLLKPNDRFTCQLISFQVPALSAYIMCFQGKYPYNIFDKW
jgi:hypothetical protein